MTTDPAGQYWSPYVGMGNNWPNGIDPDGAVFGGFRSWVNKNIVWLGKGERTRDGVGNWIYEDPEGKINNYGGSWGKGIQGIYIGEISMVGSSLDVMPVFNGSPSYMSRVFSKENAGNWGNWASNSFVPDYITIGVGGSFVGEIGASTSFEANFIIKGKYKSFKPIITVTESVQSGWNISGSINAGTGYFTGSGDLHPSFFETSIGQGDVGITASGGAGVVGITYQAARAHGGYLVESTLSIGPSAGTTLSSGVFNSFNLTSRSNK